MSLKNFRHQQNLCKRKINKRFINDTNKSFIYSLQDIKCTTNGDTVNS